MKWEKAIQTVGRIDVSKVYDHNDPAFVREEDMEQLSGLEC